ncbi:MAG TPA: DNA methyltransferase [Jiangellaceae bacterium]|nr:DNA methyltransferase [Jiangellaceae bacterium]
MTEHLAGGRVELHHGDCLDVLRTLADGSVDSVVTDPPAGIGFMGKEWDDFRRARNLADTGRESVFGRTSATGPEYARRSRAAFVAWLTDVMAEALRVLKPGGHAVVWAIPRTSHWTAWALEDAGFEIRDCLTHIFGSGFPKSLDVSKSIDRTAGVEREAKVNERWVSRYPNGPGGNLTGDGRSGTFHQALRVHGNPLMTPDPVTDDARRWSGWGTALKPAGEHWWLARKPLVGSVAATVLAYGTGALNIAACRVGRQPGDRTEYGVDGDEAQTTGASGIYGRFAAVTPYEPHTAGRWPTNLLLTHGDCSEDRCSPDCPVAEMDRQSGESTSAAGTQNFRRAETTGWIERGGSFTPGREWSAEGYGDSGGASRYFPVFRYEPKADSKQRPRHGGGSHPTVKPLDLMRWLVRLVTPPGGTCLDPFLGSGTTAEACMIEGFRCIGIEREDEYLPLIRARLNRRYDPEAFIRAGARAAAKVDGQGDLFSDGAS